MGWSKFLAPSIPIWAAHSQMTAGIWGGSEEVYVWGRDHDLMSACNTLIGDAGSGVICLVTSLHSLSLLCQEILLGTLLLFHALAKKTGGNDISS